MEKYWLDIDALIEIDVEDEQFLIEFYRWLESKVGLLWELQT